jgi:DNA-binding CsgD family transcriptional regulator/tetratricopeptide (TPR) repeat protein
VSDDGALPASQREVFRAAARALHTGPGALLTGPAGIGKSYLTAALTARARAEGTLVLSCAPAEAELQLPFVSLIDLLAPIGDDVLEKKLPVGQRAVLRAALLRGGDSEPAPGVQARLAVLTLLRALSAERPVWLVADDVQWMDEPTAEILAFVSRRTAGLPLRILATERVAAGRAPQRASLLPPGTAHLPVPALSTADLRALLEGRAGAPVPAALAREIHQAARGNPLYAIELYRAHPAQGEPLPVPPRLRALLLARLRALPDRVRATLVLASAASRPDLTLLATAGGPGVPADLEAAEALGVVRIAADGHLDFEHPLVRTVIYAEAAGQERRAAHAALAEATAEPVERARHRALADPSQDEDVARELTEAAQAARRRGAPATAADLAALAAARTPAPAARDRAERALAAAEYAADAGQWDRARRDAAELLAAAPGLGPEHAVRARIVLLKSAGQALEGEKANLEAAIAEAGGDPALESRLRLWSSTRHLLAGRVAEAVVEVRRAADLAAAAGPGEAATRIEALTDLAYILQLGGNPDAEPTLQEAFDTAAAHGIDDIRLWETLITRAILDQHAGRFESAEQRVEGMLARFGELVGVEEHFAAQLALTDIRVRAGDGPGALRAARLAAELFEDTDDSRGPALYALAAAESVGGTLRRAAELAESGARAAQRDGDRFWRLWNLTVLGRARLLLGEPARAAEVLREVWRIEREMGIVDPAIGRWHADLAEALVAQGALDEAQQVITGVSETARRLGRTSVLAAMQRAAALRQMALGDTAVAAALLHTAVEALRGSNEPLDLVRALLATADLERRRRRRAAERAALDEARAVCERVGAAAWLARVDERVGRVGAPLGERPGPGERGVHALTPAERRVAELAGSGATNREIAAACYLSVKTVEATLSRVYRKLSVRSRTELANLLPAHPETAAAPPPEAEPGDPDGAA